MLKLNLSLVKLGDHLVQDDSVTHSQKQTLFYTMDIHLSYYVTGCLNPLYRHKLHTNTVKCIKSYNAIMPIIELLTLTQMS